MTSCATSLEGWFRRVGGAACARICSSWCRPVWVTRVDRVSSMRVDLTIHLSINTPASTRLQRPPTLHTIALHLALTRLLRMQLVLSNSLSTSGAAAHYTTSEAVETVRECQTGLYVVKSTI